MPITQEESGLSAPQYTALTTATTNAKWTVIAHKYNLDFQRQTPAETLLDNESDDWDACASDADDFIVIYSQGDMIVLKEDVSDGTAPAKIATGITNSAKSPSVFEESGTIYLFTYDGSDIVRTTFTATSTTLATDSSSTIDPGLAGGEELTHLSCTSKDTVHFAVRDGDNVTNLRVAEWNGSSWDIASSEIYYTYPIQNMEASSSGGIETILIATQTPGTVSIKVTNDEVEKYIEASGGIICFTYKSGNWSDHFVIDVVENANDWRMRRGPRVTYMNGMFVATAYSVAGTERFPFATYRIYTSKDGSHWSMGVIMPIDETPDRRGIKIVNVGDTLVAVEGRYVYTTDSTLFVGHSPTSVQVDLTNYINEYSITQDKGMQADMTVDNSDGTFTGHSIINKDNTILMVHRAGFGENLIQIAETEVDYIDYDGDPSNKIITIVARDRMAWISDKTQSEEARYWEGQLVGADRYSDYTKTRYGGMRHTATQEGSWDTVDSLLQLRSSNERGVSFNTFKSYMWNGSYETSFKLAELNNGEYAGIVFRAIDKDNSLEARYIESSDVISIIQTLGGSSQTIATSSTLGWDNLNWHHMKVEFRYGKIVVLVSEDKITWTIKLTHIQEGQHDPGTYGPIVLDNGYVGQSGKGYAPEIEWTFPDFVIPDYIWTPPDFDLDDFEIDFAASDGILVEQAALVWNQHGEGAFANVFFDTEQVFKLISTPEGDVKSMCFDYGSDYIVNSGSSGDLGAYVLSSDTRDWWIYYIPNLFADTYTYTEKDSGTTTYDINSGKITQKDSIPDYIAWGFRTDQGTAYGWSSDGGDVWSDGEWTYGISEAADTVEEFDIQWSSGGTAVYVYGAPFGDFIRPVNTLTGDNAIKDNVEFTGGQPELIAGYDTDQVYMYYKLTDDNSASYQPTMSKALPPTVNSVANYDVWISDVLRAGVTPLGSYLTSGYVTESTRLEMAAGQNRLYMDLSFNDSFEINGRVFEDNWLLVLPLGNTNSGTFVWNYQLTLRDGSAYDRTLNYTLSNDVLTFVSDSGPLPPDEDVDVASISMKLDVTSFSLTGGSYSATGIEIKTFTGEKVDITYYDLIRVSDVSDTVDTDLTIDENISTIHLGTRYTDLDSLASARQSPNAVSLLAYPDGGGDQNLLYSFDGGQTWNKYTTQHSYGKVYVSPERSSYMLGTGKLDRYKSLVLTDKSGNLDDIWTASWVGKGMEVLE